MSVEITFRPIDHATWLGDGRRHYEACRFGASYRDTQKLLRYELGRLDVRRAVLELDVHENEIRLDGLPRADARPASPRVRISFEKPGVGPLQLSCDTYADYRDNIRGIAKTLEALRAVDRYGAVQRAQQYRGFRSLPDSGSANDPVSVVARHAGRSRGEVVADPIGSCRRARAAVHPDRGGSEADAAAVSAAADAILKHGAEVRR